MNITLFSLILGIALWATYRRKWDWVSYALIALLFLSIGILAELTKYNSAAMWIGAI